VCGDARYFCNVQDTSSANALNVDFGAFPFWRASIGIGLRRSGRSVRMGDEQKGSGEFAHGLTHLYGLLRVSNE
jgi:hypothetical protein